MTVTKLRFRILAKIWADLMGYFWLPCPVCGQYFSGNELKPPFSHVSLPDGSVKCVCPKTSCNEEANRRERFVALRRSNA